MSGFTKNRDELIQAQAVPTENYITATAVEAVPSSPPPTATLSTPLQGYNEAGAREFLSGSRWPLGLQETFLQNLSRIPIRFFICDDSGSMIASDGHRILGKGSNTK